MRLVLPRYFQESFKTFIAEFEPIFQTSKMKTPGERIVHEIESSLSTDVVPFTRIHDSGNDVKSIALSKIEALRPQITKEQATAETVQLDAMESALIRFLEEIRLRKSEIEHGVSGNPYGNLHFMNEAKLRIADRERTRAAM